MRVLELKVPPPILALLIGTGMWLISSLGPSVDFPLLLRNIGGSTIAACGGVLAVAGYTAFRRAQTTINSVRPAKASALVTSGIYRITRNPMYLGLLLVLIAWAVHLSSMMGFLGPFCFVLYISRFQIAPEEQALCAKFGKDYLNYTAQVRRWL